MTRSHAKIVFSQQELEAPDISDPAWATAHRIIVDRTWRADPAPIERQFSAKFLWSETALYTLFIADQHEPLVIATDPDLEKKTIGLWDRDVCEIFVAPNKSEPTRYFEFEVAPTGEWVDLSIDTSSGKRLTDMKYQSGMESFARVEAGKVIMTMKIPWRAFGAVPLPGDVWRGNIFRCVGKDPGRGYLAWQPTMTPEPNFHVPEKFGEFVFVK